MPKKEPPAPSGRKERGKKPTLGPETEIPKVEQIAPETIVEKARDKLKRNLTDIQEPAAYCCEAATTIKAEDLPAE